MNRIHQPLPMARTSELVKKAVAGELLVYDLSSDRAHCLNPTAAKIWSRCDGRTTIAEMCQTLEEDLNVPVDDEVVWLAIKELRESQLLEDSFVPPPTLKRLSRRTVMKRLGMAAAVSIPLVTSIVAPTAAAAATCRASGIACGSDADCCSNSCVDNGRGGFECS